MFKEINMQNGKIVNSKGCYAFKEVIDDFPNATDIVVLTYNISDKRNYLLNKLRDVPESANITIITNIPSRFESYFGDAYQNIARKKIKVYTERLSPDSFTGRINVYFNFENHGKIVMTNHIAYLGSSNFSDESENNRETGIITKDKHTIEALMHYVLTDVIQEAMPYYANSSAHLYYELMMATSIINEIRNDLFFAIFDENDHGGFCTTNEIVWYEGNSMAIEAGISSFANVVKQINEVIQDRFTNENEDLEDLAIIAEDFWNATRKFEGQSNDFISEQAILDLEAFDEQDETHRQVDRDFGMDAYDEYLENYISIAAKRAETLLEDLSEDARVYFQIFLTAIDAFLDRVKAFSDMLYSSPFMQINPKIDNTI